MGREPESTAANFFPGISLGGGARSPTFEASMISIIFMLGALVAATQRLIFFSFSGSAWRRNLNPVRPLAQHCRCVLGVSVSAGAGWFWPAAWRWGEDTCQTRWYPVRGGGPLGEEPGNAEGKASWDFRSVTSALGRTQLGTSYCRW